MLQNFQIQNNFRVNLINLNDIFHHVTLKFWENDKNDFFELYR